MGALEAILKSTCKECPTRCGSLIHIVDGRVVKISGNPEHPASRGAFCVKGMNAPVTAREHPNRPLYPLHRVGPRGNGRWQRISWDDALDEMAERWGAVKAKFGGPSIAGACTNHATSRGPAMALLLRGIGSPNFMLNQDLCAGCRKTASLLTGIPSEPPGNEIEHSNCIFIIGRSPSESHVVAWKFLKDAKRRAAKLIVVDPRRTQLARLADIWLPIKPGTDAALALAMMHVLFEEDLIDHDFVDAFCDGLDALKKRCRQYTPAYAESLTGLPAESIIEVARLFATAKPGLMLLGHGIDAQSHGVMTAMAFYSLLALTGNVDVKGGNRAGKPLPGFRDYYSIMNAEKAFALPLALQEKVIGSEQFPLWSGPKGWSKSSHNPSVIRAIITGEPYPVRALYVSGANILCTYPGMEQTIEALKSLDSLVVATDHITPTAELADIILPKTTLLEEEDVYLEPNGPCLSPNRKVFEPAGEAKTDIEIAIALTDKLRACGLIDYDVLPWRTHREFIDYQMAGTGVTFDEICDRGFHPISFEYQSYRHTGFPTATKKIQLAPPELEALIGDTLPSYHPPHYLSADAQYDLVLLTGIRSMAYDSSRFRHHGWARRLEDAPELRIHPSVANRIGVKNREWIWVEVEGNQRRVYLKAIVTEDVPPNVVATGMGWWFPELDGFDRGALTFNLDAAIAYGPPWDPISGSAEARNVACRVGRAEQDKIEAMFGRVVAELVPS